MALEAADEVTKISRNSQSPGHVVSVLGGPASNRAPCLRLVADDERSCGEAAARAQGRVVAGSVACAVFRVDWCWPRT